MEDLRFNLFWGFYSKQSTDIALEELYKLITTSADLRHITERHRADLGLGLKEDADGWKKKTAAIIVATHTKGTHAKRDIENYTGYSLADFDHLSAQQLTACLQKLEGDPYRVMSYTSIGGSGLHIMFRIPQVKNETDYRKAFHQGNAHYAQLFGMDYDWKNADATRVMGINHDPQCVYNPQAEAYPVDFSKPVPKPAKDTDTLKETKKRVSKVTFDKMVERAEKAVKRSGSVYEPGNHNDYIMKVVYKLNRMGAKKSMVMKWGLDKFTDYGESNVRSVINSCYNEKKEHGNEKQRESRPWATPTDTTQFLRQAAQFRKNAITRYTEMLPKGQTEWRRLTDYEVNSLWLQMDAQADLPRPRGVKEFFQILDSSFVPLYNPFEEYLQGLPEWHEGDPDYLGELAATVHTTDDEHFGGCLRKWMVGMVAAWLRPDVVNQTIMVFIGEQGIYKTKWFNSLLPPALQPYCVTRTHSDQFSKDDRLLLAESALICYEEIDSPQRGALAQLKAMVTMEKVNERAAYARNKEERAHIASFCATGNNKQFLVDPTGNRRWLAFEVLEITDPYTHPIDYDHVYGQVMALLRSGFRYYFTQEEIRRLNQCNEEFMSITPEEELLLAYFRHPTRMLPGRYLTATQVMAHCGMYVHQPLHQRAMVEALKKHNYAMHRRGNSRCYYVLPLDAAQVNDASKPTAEEMIESRL